MFKNMMRARYFLMKKHLKISYQLKHYQQWRRKLSQKKKKKKNCKIAIQKKLETKHVKTVLLIDTDATSFQMLSLTNSLNSLSSNDLLNYSSTY